MFSSDQKIELSFQESGKILGVEFSSIATVTTAAGPNGTIYGEGQALLTTKDGESISWKRMGICKRTGPGMAVSYRGAKAFQTFSQKLAKLNTMMIVFEAEADENGLGLHKHWEWK
jgi:hypothetical protein